MIGHNLLRIVEIAGRTSAIAVSATSTDYNGSVYDMSGYEGIAFIALITGTPTSAGFNMHIEAGSSSSLSTGSDVSDLIGSAVFVTTGIADGVLAADLYRPAQRYVRFVLDRVTTDDAVDGVLVLRYGANQAAVTHSTADVYSVEYFTNPATGSAT